MAVMGHSSHPVDKGWAWVILIGSFGLNFFLVGYIRSFGLLFVAFQKKYGYTAGMVSLVAGAQNVAFCLVSLFTMHFLLRKISVRTACLLGVVFQVVGVALSNAVPNSVYLVLCLGMLFGIGQGLMRYPSLYILAQYFEQRRSLAVTFASCGSSVGGFAFPYAVQAFLDMYGLQGSLLLIAGMMMQIILCVMIFTPPTDYGVVFVNESSDSSDDENLAAPPAADQHLLNNGGDDPVDVGLSSNSLYVSPTSSPTKRQRLDSTVSHDEWKKGSSLELACYENHKLSSASLNNIQDKRANDSTTVATSSEEKSKCCKVMAPDVFHYRLFWVLLFYFMSAPAASGLPSIFVPPLAREKGLADEDGAFLLTISAIMDIFGRITPGVVLHFKWLSPSQFSLIPQTIGCVVYSLTFILHDYTGLLIFSLIYGFISSAFFAIQTLLVIEVLGMTHLASAMGFYALGSGLAMGISSPIAGFIRDIAGTYSASYVYFAILFLLSNVSIVIVLILMKREVKNAKSSNHIGDEELELEVKPPPHGGSSSSL